MLGLDSASSTELLTHLNALAASNRTVVLTIHQPRLEIFHMFHRIVVLSDGKVRICFDTKHPSYPSITLFISFYNLGCLPRSAGEGV